MPIKRVDTTMADPYIPEAVRWGWSEISEAGYDVNVEVVGIGLIRAWVQTERILVWIMYTNTSGRWKWRDSTLKVDGMLRPIADSPQHLLSILADPDSWAADRPTLRRDTYAARRKPDDLVEQLNSFRDVEPLVYGKPVEGEKAVVPRAVRNHYAAWIKRGTNETSDEVLDSLDPEHKMEVHDDFVWRAGPEWAATAAVDTPEGKAVMTTFFVFDGRTWSASRTVIENNGEWKESQMDITALLRRLLGLDDGGPAQAVDDQTPVPGQRRPDAPRGKNDRLAVHKKTVFRV